ncbi:MAG: hypothetical protein HYX26_09720 [Acidobacteriales bacterium]|nr:hypothetical protein [Terriglobales bacterium]
MKNRWWILFAAALTLCLPIFAQPAPAQPPQPLTIWYEYTVNPGQEDAFMELVNKVGAPVRDRLMAEGVVEGWGIEVPVLRGPGKFTHLIWVSVRDYAGAQKVWDSMRAQMANIAAEEAKMAKKPAKTTAERAREIFDGAKTRDWLTRDLVSGFAPAMPPAGMLPFNRYNFVKVKPGKGGDYRRTWEKYNKPVFDKLTADGTLLAYGMAVEEWRTEGAWTHFIWFVTKDAAAQDKIRDAFNADRAARTQEQRDAIMAAFADAVDGDASRQEATRSTVFKLAPPKK